MYSKIKLPRPVFLRYFFPGIFLWIMVSCSSPTSLAEVREQIENPENELTLTIRDKQNPQLYYTLSLFPANYISALQQVKSSAQTGSALETKPLAYFRLKTNKPDFLFRASEENFQLTVDGNDFPASIVVAENLGSEQTNRLMIGFPEELFTHDLTLRLQDYNQQTLAAAPFSISAYDRITKLNIR